MELLMEITNRDIGENPRKTHYSPRKAARAVLFRGNKIALLYVSKKNYHKLPGGGVKKGESVKSALLREIREETGCEAEIGEKIGIVVEYRDDFGEIQLSHCFIARVKRDLGEKSFTPKEMSEGFQLKWVLFSQALSIMRNDRPSNYEGKFIVKRDMAFLEKCREIMEKESS